MAATAKHFPGLGSAATPQNTDAGPVTLDVSLSGLREKDEVPYQAAIAAGVKLIMASWAVCPALDASYPAGLSPAVVQYELRGRLGFKGVTITDAIEAKALTRFGSYGQHACLPPGPGWTSCCARRRTRHKGSRSSRPWPRPWTAGNWTGPASVPLSPGPPPCGPARTDPGTPRASGWGLLFSRNNATVGKSGENVA